MPWRALATETAVLLVFATGLLVSRRLGRRWAPTELLLMYAVGLLFEVLTAFMWRYHHILFILPTPIDDDISILFPLGWAGLITGTTALAETLERRWGVTGPWRRHLLLAGVWLVWGDCAETIFHRIGMIEYLRTPATEINFRLGQFPGFPPNAILLGYGIVQPFASRLFQRLERDLGAGGPR